MKHAHKAAFLLFLATATPRGGAAQATTAEVRQLPLIEAKRVMDAYASTLPQDLPLEATRDSKAWAKYIEQKETELQSRLEQGDLDTLANLLLFGTSFTKEPVLTPAVLQQIAGGANGPQKASSTLGEAGGTGNAYQGRLRDLAVGIAYPGENERLQYMRALLQRKGFRFETAADYNKLGSFLASNLLRMLAENEKLAEALERAKEADPGTEFNTRSQVFARRGISLDTTIFPNFALEEALKQLKDKGVIQPGTVRRVAIIGPGLDTMNKDVGFDYYPEQTTQPFAVADSLVRLGLAREDQLRITTLDISERVNAHIRAAQEKARSGAGYLVQLPIRSNIQWAEGSLSYWKEFGSAIGEEAKPILPPAGANEPKTRAVRIRAGIVLRIRVRHLDVVYEGLALPASEEFDLVVGTNIFVYYGAFEQALAELNLAAMLQAKGVVLTNDSLPTKGQEFALDEIGFSTTRYSDREMDGDRIVWLQRRQTRK